MILRDANIIGYFSKMMQQEILKFCDRINNTDADVLIMMARKAPCFFQVLVENGYIRTSVLKKMIITDRAVDFSIKYIKDKKVAIIDDVIFSGTTIAKMINYIEKFSPLSIEVIVLAINNESFKMKFKHSRDAKEMINREHCARLNDAECTKLCSDISRVLSLIGKPYDVDFPAHHNVYCKLNELPWTNYLQYFKWFNVSNTYQKQVEIDTYTIIPLEPFASIVWRYLKCNLEEVCECKIRAYTYKVNELEYKLKLLPMVIINELSIGRLNKIFEIVEKHLNKLIDNESSLEFLKKLENETAKFRFIQYYLAELFLQAFISVTNIKRPGLRKYSIRYLLGYDFEDEIELILQKDIERFSNEFNYLKISIPVLEKLEAENIQPDLLGYNPETMAMYIKRGAYDINEVLLEPFRYWYKTKEISVRDNLADESITLDDARRFQGLTRLEEGYSFNALCKIAEGLEKYYNSKDVVSIFIDRAIDFGILVPIVYFNRNKKYICRAFRHGEDLPYCNVDKNLILFFINELATRVKNTFSLKQFHKIIVLYMQLGTRKHLFNEFCNFNYSDLLTAEYTLQGAVPVIVKGGIDPENMHPYIVYNDYNIWLSDEFQRKEILKSETLDQFVIDSSKISVNREKIAKSALTDSELLAMVISEWFEICVKMQKKSVFTEDITILTTCYDTTCFAAAMLAELYVCQLDVKETILEKLENYSDNSVKEYFIKKLRKGNAFLAMNSGRKKYQWYKKNANNQNRMDIAIENVSRLFEEEQNKYAELIWNGYWSEYTKLIPSQDELDVHILEAVEYIWAYNILYRKMEILFNPQIRGKNEREIEELKDELEMHFLDSNIRNDLFNLNSVNMAISVAERLNSVVLQQMREIERATVKNRNSYIEVYTASLMISVRKNIAERIRNLLPALQDKYFGKNKSNSTWFELENEAKTNFILVVKENVSDIKSKLVEASVELHANLGKDNINLKTIVILGLPREKAYRQNIKENSTENQQQFIKYTVNPFFEYLALKESVASEIMFVSPNEQSIYSILVDDINYVNKSLPNYKNDSYKIAKIQQCEREFVLMEFREEIKKIGIITVIPEEVRAVLKFFSMEKMDKSKTKQQTQRTYYRGAYSDKTRSYDLIMTQCPKQGNQAAMSTYYSINQDFDLDYVVLLGVAGSVNKEKLKVCDVVIAREIVDGQLGKETGENEFSPETSVYSPNAIVNNGINDFLVMSDEFESAEGAPTDKFKCLYEPIGDNNHLIGSPESKFITNAKTHITRKIVAVEMESAGVMYGAYMACLDAKCENAIVIRGISDYADPDKPSDNKYHYLAALNAAKVLQELLSYLE